jgi:hypothetical protein
MAIHAEMKQNEMMLRIVLKAIDFHSVWRNGISDLSLNENYFRMKLNNFHETLWIIELVFFSQTLINIAILYDFYFFTNLLHFSKYHAWSHHPKNIQLNLLRVNKLNVSKSIIISSLSIMSMSCYIVIMLRCQNITPFIHPHYIFYTFNSLYFHFNFFFLSILLFSSPFNFNSF